VTGLIAVVIGATLGLRLGSRSAGAESESQLVMRLLELETSRGEANARAGRCARIPERRIELLHALVGSIGPSLRDSLLVDSGFMREANRLGAAVAGLARLQGRNGCQAQLRAYAQIREVCGDCHRAYRSGG